jgi:hypothetical protein
MARKSSKSTPVVLNGILYTLDEHTTGITLNGPAWSPWLEDAEVFYFDCGVGSFTAKKLRQHKSYYWFAYKKLSGRTVKKYLGMREAVTADRLKAMCEQFAALMNERGVNAR